MIERPFAERMKVEWRVKKEGHVSPFDSNTNMHKEAPFARGSVLFPDVTDKGFTGVIFFKENIFIRNFCQYF